MRIAHYSNCYKPRVNGVVRSVSVFKEALENLGHEVYLFVPQAPGYQDEEPHIYRYPTLPIETSITYRIAIPFSSSLDSVALSLGLDVIHTHQSALMGWAALHQATRLGLPLVCTLHSQYQAYGAFLPVGQQALAYVSKKATLLFLRACTRVIVPTEAMRKRIASDCPELEPRLAVLPTPLAPAAFAAREAPDLRQLYGLGSHFTFAVASRLSPEKGLHELLQAFALLHRVRPDVLLFVLGDGPERKDLEKEALELGIADQVIFAGMVPFEQMPRHLAAADAFVFSSQVEAQGIVLNEAMAAGLPVVAYDAPFIRDTIVDGENGLLSEAQPEALARLMQVVVDDQELRKRLARAGREAARRYDPARIAGNLVRLYQEAIDEHRRRILGACPSSWPTYSRYSGLNDPIWPRPTGTAGKSARLGPRTSGNPAHQRLTHTRAHKRLGEIGS